MATLGSAGSSLCVGLTPRADGSAFVRSLLMRVLNLCLLLSGPEIEPEARSSSDLVDRTYMTLSSVGILP